MTLPSASQEAPLAAAGGVERRLPARRERARDPRRARAGVQRERHAAAALDQAPRLRGPGPGGLAPEQAEGGLPKEALHCVPLLGALAAELAVVGQVERVPRVGQRLLPGQHALVRLADDALLTETATGSQHCASDCSHYKTIMIVLECSQGAVHGMQQCTGRTLAARRDSAEAHVSRWQLQREAR